MRTGPYFAYFVLFLLATGTLVKLGNPLKFHSSTNGNPTVAPNLLRFYWAFPHTCSNTFWCLRERCMLFSLAKGFLQTQSSAPSSAAQFLSQEW